MTTPEQQAIAAAADRAAEAMRIPPDVGAVYAALARVPDPEIPVVSVIELGIVREVRCIGGAWHVTVTPTYSGCPASDVIVDGIRDALRSIGVADVHVDTVLSPAWGTDWIAPEARARMREYGIAPPGVAGVARVAADAIGRAQRSLPTVACPRCGSTATSELARFGSTTCKAHYRCDACGEPFEYFKVY